jgi:[ribosomal protein S5]-alanine N-acetyltransferase
MVPTLETARLILRPLALEDAPAVQRIFPRWEIVQYLNARVPWPYPEDGAADFIRNVALPAMERGEQLIWGVHIKGGPEHLAGVVDLTLEGEENRGFWLAPEWQGQGYMSEACEAAMDFWFNVLGKEVMRVSKAVDNVRSRRVSEREGGRMIAVVERDFLSGRLPAQIWELTREAWNARARRVSR